MFNINYNDIKKSKKEYTHTLKNTDINSYKLHEKIATSLNHSIQSNISETTASKSNTNKTFSSRYNKMPVNEKNNNPIKRCSYIDFLELRKTKNTYPFGNQEKRFKWQNLKEENIVIYPEIYKKPRRKQFLLKENYGEGLLGFLKNRQVFDDKPKIRRLRRSHSEEGREKENKIQNIDIDISRRVIDPSFNKEKEVICKKKSFSQSKFILHRIKGNFKSLFNLTPIDIPIKGKKLFKNKSYGALTINLFDNNYGQYQIPTHTKKHFFDNKCHYDHIKAEDLVHEMNNCWKRKGRNKSTFLPTFKTDVEIFLSRNVNNMRLRQYEGNNSINNTMIFTTLSKIRREKKKK